MFESELLLFFFWDAILDALGTKFLAKMQLRLNEMLGYDDFLFPFHKCIHVTTIIIIITPPFIMLQGVQFEKLQM